MRTVRGPVTGGRAWLGALVLLVAIRAGTGTLGSLLAPGPWLGAATLVAATALTAAAVTRHLGRPAWAPGSAWLAVLVSVLVGYGGPGAGPALPGPESPGRIAELLGEGIRGIVDGRIPVVPARGIELWVVLGAAAAAVVADALCLGLGSAGLAGVPIAALWAPTVVFELPPSTASMLVGGTAWALLLGVTRPRRARRARGPAEAAGTAAAAAGVALVAVLLGPLASAVPLYASVRLPATWGPGIGVGSVTLSDDLDMRADLGQQPATVVLTYRTDVADLGPLRTTTVTGFDGRRWASPPPQASTPTTGLLWPTAVGGDPDGTVTVTIEGLDQDVLPIPVEPRTVDVGEAWAYDPARDLVTGPGTAGLVYTATVVRRDLSPEALRADRPTPLPADAPELAVPDTPYRDHIADLATEVTAEARTAYDKAMALQEYLRSSGGFRYTLDVPPAQTEDAVWDFLQDRTGYCVQFATAMTVMARIVGIPTRVGIGFLPGTRDAQGVATVTGKQAHAWPELWFAEAGWVRFEPTPAVQTGAPPAYADPAIPSPGSEPTSEPGLATAAPTAPVPVVPTTAPGAQQTVGSTTSLLQPAVGALAAIAAAGAVLALRRRRRRPRWDAEAAWGELRSRAARVGVTWPDSATPRRAGELLRAATLVAPGPSTDADAAIGALVRAVEAERYEPDGDTTSHEQLDAWLDAAVEPWQEVSRAAGAGAPSGPRGG